MKGGFSAKVLSLLGMMPKKEIIALAREKDDAENRLLELTAKLDVTMCDNKELGKRMEEKDVKLQNFDLVCTILGADSGDHAFIKQFELLVTKNFLEFCNIESNVNDVITKLKLDFVLDEMRRIANCPELYNKTLGAIGGGFSSGKSSLANSFITCGDVKLAVGIKPVTAIPSYVMCAEKSEVNGINYKGARFPIATEMYAAMSHEFLKSFSFNLKEIIQYTTVLCPLNVEYFENICLIDTPGYNPPNSGSTEKDFTTALDYIKEASFLIWTVGLDVNGTMPKSDLDFLEKTEFGQNKDKPLYIVANKAELKTVNDLEAILDTFEECLDDHDIHCEGISAYSSKKKEEFVYRKMGITGFLKSRNTPNKKYAALSDLIKDVWAEYETEIRRDHKENEQKRKEVKSMLLDALESNAIGLEDASGKLEEGLNQLMRYFMSEKGDITTRLGRLNELKTKFQDCLDGFCEKKGIDRSVKTLKEEVVFCTNCGKRLKAEATFCTDCGKKL
jgi:hypothetical protein